MLWTAGLYLALVECSTPFGITEVGIHHPAQRPDLEGVLNAFRHHRGGHDLPWASWPPEASAQRLSASQRWAYALAPASHQRSSWCSTPFGITEVGMPIAETGEDDEPLCSTPFGITEVGISHGKSNVVDTTAVLNAFRHHRGGHIDLLVGLALAERCSTPFGITEVGMWPG